MVNDEQVETFQLGELQDYPMFMKVSLFSDFTLIIH